MSSIVLVDVHDTDLDHDVGGQDLPFLVTAKVEGPMQEAEATIHASDILMAFNIQPSVRLGLAGHIEFCTFAFPKEIDKFFGIIRPKTPDEELRDKFARSVYARTAAELRAAIADLPDDFPILHSQMGQNRAGVHVVTGEWSFVSPGSDRDGYPCWSLRLSSLDESDWLGTMTREQKNVMAEAK